MFLVRLLRRDAGPARPPSLLASAATATFSADLLRLQLAMEPLAAEQYTLEGEQRALLAYVGDRVKQLNDDASYDAIYNDIYATGRRLRDLLDRLLIVQHLRQLQLEVAHAARQPDQRPELLLMLLQLRRHEPLADRVAPLVHALLAAGVPMPDAAALPPPPQCTSSVDELIAPMLATRAGT
jgi:hypothetical protein